MVAAARPVLPVMGALHAPTALVLVFDNSASPARVVDGRPAMPPHGGPRIRNRLAS